MSATGVFEVLPPREVLSLVRRYLRRRDPRDLDRLVRAHYRLVAKIAREYLWSRQDLRDLMQVGSIGLLRAIEKFDPERGVLLSTYAVHWIRAYILRHILDNWRLVRVGTTQRQRQLFHRARRDEEALTPKDRALHQHLIVPELSLDAPLPGTETAPQTRLSLLRAPEDQRPDVIAENEELRARLNATVGRFAAGLTGRDRAIFEKRWQRPDPPTLASIALELGISRERARQLERRILDRLEAYLDDEVGDLRGVTLAAAEAAHVKMICAPSARS